MDNKSKIAFFSLALPLTNYLPTCASALVEEQQYDIIVPLNTSYNPSFQKEVWVELSIDVFDIKDIRHELERQTNATHLSLAERCLGDEALEVIGAFENLSYLYLEENSFTDDGVHFLQSLPFLKEIDLSKNRITHKGLSFVPLDHLQVLHANFLSLNDVSFLHKLVSAPYLKELYVMGTGLDSKALEIIGESNSLTRLDISNNTKITSQDIQQLQIRRPKLIIFNN